MDIATFVGIISGTAIVLWAILMGCGLGTFFDVPSLMITVGGTIAATLINFPLNKVIGTVRVAKNAFLHKEPDPSETISKLVEFGVKARREGILVLEEQVERENDAFLQKGLRLAVDGTPPEVIREILSRDLDFLEQRHVTGHKILKAMGGLAPAFGMIGTLIGLVQMLRTLDDPSKIGSGMAVALLTTFYGSMMANLVFLPLAGKLEYRTSQEVLLKGLMIEGILAIQSGDNPRIIEEKLKAFVSPEVRQKMEKAA